MTREEKSQVIETLTAELAEAKTLYLTDIAGLDAATTSDLRRASRRSCGGRSIWSNITILVLQNFKMAKF